MKLPILKGSAPDPHCPNGVDISIWANGEIWVIPHDLAHPENLTPIAKTGIISLCLNAAQSLPEHERRSISTALRVAASQIHTEDSSIISGMLETFKGIKEMKK